MHAATLCSQQDQVKYQVTTYLRGIISRELTGQAPAASCSNAAAQVSIVGVTAYRSQRKVCEVKGLNFQEGKVKMLGNICIKQYKTGDVNYTGQIVHTV